MPPTRIALVGVNHRARRLLLPGLAASPRAQVTAICSRDLEKARATAASLGPDVRSFTHIQDAITASAAEAVYLNTPLETHVPLATTALRAGWRVICEKPLAPTLDEALTLAAEAEHAATCFGARTAVNFTYRSVPGFRLTERWLASQTIGRPLHARFELLQGHNFLPDFPRASALLDSGSHLFDLMASLLQLAGFGEIQDVSGTPLTHRDIVPGEPDYGWSLTASTSSGVTAAALFSRSTLGWRNGLRWTLSGDAAAIEVELDADRTTARAVHAGDGAPQGTWRPLALPEDIASDDVRFPAYHLDRLVGAIRGEETFPDFRAAVLPNRIAAGLLEGARPR